MRLPSLEHEEGKPLSRPTFVVHTNAVNVLEKPEQALGLAQRLRSDGKRPDDVTLTRNELFGDVRVSLSELQPAFQDRAIHLPTTSRMNPAEANTAIAGLVADSVTASRISCGCHRAFCHPGGIRSPRTAVMV